MVEPPKITIEKRNTSCKYFPCHKNLEDCTFCYCPFYACQNTKRGKFIEKDGKTIWDCSNCEWIHKKKTVDKLFK
jgi:precorrin-3B C17-methyltransferase